MAPCHVGWRGGSAAQDDIADVLEGNVEYEKTGDQVEDEGAMGDVWHVNSRSLHDIL